MKIMPVFQHVACLGDDRFWSIRPVVYMSIRP